MGNELREMESYIINDTIALHDRANGKEFTIYICSLTYSLTIHR